MLERLVTVTTMLALLLVGACNTTLTVPNGAKISCASASDCPTDYRCVSSVCVSLTAPQPPRVVVGTPARAIDVVEIPVTVSDFDEGTVTLTAEVDVGQGFVPATIDALAVQATADGVAATVRWHAATQLGSAAYVPQVVARITPAGGSPAVSPAFAFGNDPPVLTAPPVTGTRSFDVGLAFTLTDTSGDLSRVDISFGTSATGPWKAAAIGLGATSSLATSTAGIEHAVIWSSSAAPASDPTTGQGVGRPIRQDPVYLQLVPSDTVLGTTFTGAAVVLGPFVVDNTFNAPPEVTVLAPDGLQSGIVLVSYVLADAESDPSSLTVEFMDERGVFARATAATGGDGTTALASSPTGLAHVFAWDSVADRVALSGEDSQVQVRIAATGTVLGTFGTSPAFSVDNRASNQRPQVSIIAPAGVVSGDVPIAFTLTDAESDACDVSLELSRDGGSTWTAATAGPRTGLTSSPSGWLHTLTWSSATDHAGVSRETLTLRMRASQFTPAQDSDFAVVTISVDNGATLNTPPSLELVDYGPSGVAPGSYDIWILARDAESDPIEIDDLSYTFVSLAPGQDPANDAPWLSLRLSGTSLGNLASGTGLATSPAGVLHRISWNTVADLALPLPFELLVVRTGARDAYHASPRVLLDGGLGPQAAPAAVQLYSDPATGAGSGLALLSRGSGDLHAFWATPFSGSAGTLWHAASHDFGATWTAPAAGFLAIQTRDPAVADVPGVGILVAYSTLTSTTTQLRVVRSVDGGTTWQSPASITTSFTDAEQPYLFAESASVVHLVWREWAASKSQVFYARSTNGGQSFGAPVAVSGLESGVQNPYPAVTASGGVIHVAWLGATANLKATTSTDNGASFSQSPSIITSAGGFASYMRLLPTPDGVVHLALLNTGVQYARRATSGAWTIQTLDADGRGAPFPFLAPTGDLVVGYYAMPGNQGALSQNRTITSHDSGLTWDAPVKVLDGAWQLTAMDKVTGQLSFLTLQQPPTSGNLYPFYTTLSTAPLARKTGAGTTAALTFDDTGALRAFTSLGLATVGYPWSIQAMPLPSSFRSTSSLSVAAGRALGVFGIDTGVGGPNPSMALLGSNDDGNSWPGALGARIVGGSLGPDGRGYAITGATLLSTFSAIVSPDGVTWSGTPTSLTTLGAKNTQPVLSWLMGKLRLLYVDSSAANTVIRSTTSTDGVSWTTPVNVSQSAQNAQSPVLLARADGKLFAMWAEYNGATWQPRLAASVDDGISFGAPVNAGTETLPAGALSATLDPEGLLWLGWATTAGTASTGVSRDGGVTWGETLRHSTAGVASVPALASDVRGTYVVWKDPTLGLAMRTLRPAHVLSAGLPSALPIPDGTGSVTSTLTVADDDTLHGVAVWLDVAHPRPADLTITLTHMPPTGAPLTLTLARNGGPLRAPVVLTDSGLHATDALAALEGRTLAGTWTLTVTDAVTGSAGQLNDWGLRFR